MKRHHWGYTLILIGLAMDVYDEMTAGSTQALGSLYGGTNFIAQLDQKLPIDPGLILIGIGTFLVYSGHSMG